mmetsp:Transcript_49941/g.124609  ORF Transcript_49941/g.124609 Transcript_49941/m.124609 type:complete len:175 (-) Transcript_49941:143-667(-)
MQDVPKGVGKEAAKAGADAAKAVGGVFQNLKSGKGLFGEELTKKYARKAIETAEEQLAEVSEEMRAEEPAKKIRKSDQAVKSAAPPPKPEYTEEDRWSVTVAETGGGSPLEVTVRPTQKASLLLKAWCGDNDVDPNDCEMVVRGNTWKTGVVDLSDKIGETGIVDGLTVTVRGK